MNVVVGIMGISGMYSIIQPNDVKERLQNMLLTCNLRIDTADVYSNKIVISDLLAKSLKHEVKVQEKIGANSGINASSLDLYKESVRLIEKYGYGVDRILIHRPSEITVERDIGALLMLSNSYPMVEIGICTNNLKLVKEFCHRTKIRYVQAALNLLDISRNINLINYCSSQKLILQARSVLSGGILSDRYIGSLATSFQDPIRKRYTESESNAEIFKKRLISANLIYKYYISSELNMKMSFSSFNYAVVSALLPVGSEIVIGGSSLQDISSNCKQFSIDEKLVDEVRLQLNDWEAPYI